MKYLFYLSEGGRLISGYVVHFWNFFFLQRKHGSHLQRYTALTASRKRKMESEKAPSTSRQLTLGETKLVTQKNVDHAVLNFVTQSLQPFSVVEQPSFKAFLHDLQPNTSLMSRPTWMDEAALQMKTNMKKAMSEIDFIATTTDCWSSRRRGFIGVTAHWVDPNSLERCSVALACRQLKGPHTFDVLACALNDIHWQTEQGCSNYYGQWVKFFKGISYIYGEQDENNNFALEETEDEISDVMCDEDEEDVDGVEVDFVEVTAVLDEDDGLQFQLPKHHRCACHLLNLVSTVDAAKACSNEAFKKLSRSAKCHALRNKCGRSAAAAEIVEDMCKIQLIRPNTTRWHSLFLAVERVLRIIKDQGEGAIRTVCTSLKLPMSSPVEIAFLEEYAGTMSPLDKALNILQAEIDVQMGWLLPTLTLLILKLDRIRISSRYCKPLVDAIQGGLQQRFGNMLVEPEFIAAAILVPKFKTSWTADEHIVKLGLDYIKDHLEEETSNETPVGQEGIRQLDGNLPAKLMTKKFLSPSQQSVSCL
ncbi:uncharacterized protein LOC131359012 [Hemibagrus wyckioides]|uniref:uncharacterized protein LOC131359012 n=1 Tax=Hemibagrus wyckioides TaxID=337641 RepID=UPI00266C4F24|nr:uncharacterized protein LOC131359012 [Hemibagrus wyckioides]